MASVRSLTAFVISIKLSLALAAYSSFQSPGGNFMLQWKYMDGKLMFKATCMTVGWCGVGFTESADGKNMVNYDIVVGGYASGTGYLKDYFSLGRGPPPEDTQQDYNLTNASESNGKTVIEFYRLAMTGDSDDVQFTENTTVWIVWAFRDNDDADTGLSMHSDGDTGRSPMRYNLIEMAMSVNTTKAATSTTKSPTTIPVYSSLKSPDNKFMLNWKYMDGKLMFKMTCEARGWCAVGFTQTEDGANMSNYDIAVGGYASGAGYLTDRWSKSLGAPPEDMQQDFNLTSATEMDGKTMVEFYRKAKTGDNKDVQFESDTLVWVVWAYHNSLDADGGISGTERHDDTGISSMKYNLITGAPETTESPTTNSARVTRPTVVFFLLFVFATFFFF